MASILGDVGAVELTKFYSGLLPRTQIGTLIEVDLMEPRINSRKVLKVPRCPVCSPVVGNSSRTVDSNVFMPGNDPE